MARHKRQDQEPDRISADESLACDEDGFVLDSPTAEQQDDEEEDREPIFQPVAWHYLSETQHHAKRSRVHVWLEQPHPQEIAQIVADVQALAVDRLVRDAYKDAYQRQQQLGASQQSDGKRREVHSQNAEAAAASWAKVFKDDLCTLLVREQSTTDEVDEVVRSTLRKGKPASGIPDDLDRLLGRCANQLVAYLVFKHLKNMRPEEIIWGVLLRRFVERIILPGEPESRRVLADMQPRSPVERSAPRKRRGPIGPISNDQLSNCIQAIFEGVKTFSYEGLGQAFTYFKYLPRTCRQLCWYSTSGSQEIVQEPNRLEELPAAQDEDASTLSSTSLPPFPALVKQLGREGAIRYWIVEKLKERLTQEQTRPRDFWPAIASYALEPECGILDAQDLPLGVSWPEVYQTFRVMADRSRSTPGRLTENALKQLHSRCQREVKKLNVWQNPLWDIMLEVLGRPGAIMQWILHRLHERLALAQDPQSVEEIGHLVLQSRCGRLDDQALPPGVSWEEVQQVFHTAPHRFHATPGRLSSDELQHFYRFSKQQLRHYGREHQEADPRL